MASIFTYDPDPPRVSSPWPQAVSSGRVTPANGFDVRDLGSGLIGGLAINEAELLDASSSARLEAEPQEGPTEYKLHLLLRPRTSTPLSSSIGYISGSQHSKSGSGLSRNTLSSTPPTPGPPASSNVSRQHRLEQLTTQLLWRLQQSSPYHATSTSNLVLPELPTAAPELQPPEQLARLTPGLEESKGALYEIGVADDGALIGLTFEEMRESLNNLRAMAASLGCTVEVRRMICVGDREGVDASVTSSSSQIKLFVAEAFVQPSLQEAEESRKKIAQMQADDTLETDRVDASAVEQIRITLTGATTCGKSSILGTLSTSTLDNGRGKSRLSLLKHRHEIASGVTSSVAQELVGYHEKPGASIKVVNYADGNISTWNDIHASGDLSRLALLSDSAGHPRYRRTTMRGLVGWAPHWTLLCVAANEDAAPPEISDEDGSSSKSPALPGANAHISMAHLDICLKLDLPLVVIVTKLDEAKRSSFTQLLSSLLTVLKNAGRRPLIMTNTNGQVHEHELQTISTADLAEVEQLAEQLSDEGGKSTVPILFTSAVKGTGIGKLHALLCCLPILPSGISSQHPNEPPVFHVDDDFDISVQSTKNSSVVSGYLSHYTISIGDILLFGPFAPSAGSPIIHGMPNLAQSDANGPFLSPRSFVDALAKTTSSPRLRPFDPSKEWRRVKIVSIRNLRLPVRTLQPDQIGTIGIVPLDHLDDSIGSIRKGMVLTSGNPCATHTLTTRFSDEEASSFIVGTVVILYCASVRASARVVAVALDNSDENNDSFRHTYGHDSRSARTETHGTAETLEEDAAFFLDEELNEKNNGYADEVSGNSWKSSILVTFQFVAYREWIETGAKILAMPGGGLVNDRHGARGAAIGLEGFVGEVVETFG